MKTKHLTYLLAIICGLTSCIKKEDLPECLGSCTVVTGRLLTSGSEPLSNATVTLQWTGGTGSFGSSSRKKAVSHTDTNGRYRVSGFLTDAELVDGFLEVVFSPDKSKYYLIGEPSVAFFRPKRDTIYTAPDFLLPRKAFVTFIVTNPNQIPTNFSYYVDLNSCYGTNLVFSSNILGGGVSLSCYGLVPPYNTVEVAGNQPILLKQRKSRVAPNDTLLIAAGTTRTYLLTY